MPGLFSAIEGAAAGDALILAAIVALAAVLLFGAEIGKGKRK